MSYSQHYVRAVDEFGNVIPNPTIRVRKEEAGAPPAALYSDAGITPKSNSFVGDSVGVGTFFVEGGLYRIDVSKDGQTFTQRNVPIGTTRQYDIEDVNFDAIKQPATTAYLGVVELATTGEASAATSTTLAVTPQGLASYATSVGSAQLPRGYIDGGILSNNVTDAVNDINISAGVCRDSTNTYNIVMPAMTKRLDATFVAGTNQGFRHTAAIADTTYHIYAIMTAAGVVDYFATTTYGNPTGVAGYPATYVRYRYIMSIIRVGATIIPFVQAGDEVIYATPRVDYANNSPGVINQLEALASIPNGIEVFVRTSVYYEAGNGIYIGHGKTGPVTKANQGASSTTYFASFNNTGSHGGGMQRSLSSAAKQLVLDTASNVRSVIAVHGWTSQRGRDL